MKFTTFRNLIIAGAASGLFGSLYYFTKSAVPTADAQTAGVQSKTTSANATPEGAKPEAAPPAAVKPEPTAEAASRISGTPAPSSATSAAATKADHSAPRGAHQTTRSGHPLLPMRPFDEEIIRLFEQTPSAGKVKDATPNRPYKVNLYAEGGKHVRAKVDLNRNNKWDEKWSVDEKNGERVYKRQVSPADDDTNYPEKYKLHQKQWEKTEP